MKPQVWKQIFFVSLWNIIVMFVLAVFGDDILNLEYDRFSPSTVTDSKLKQFSVIYNVFVFLQLFNMINCRKLGMRDFNIFERFFHNNQYLFILAIAFIAQFVQVQYLNIITKTAPLTKEEWGGCIFIGSTVLAVDQLVKLIPDSVMDKIPIGKLIDENKAMNNRVLRMWKGEANPASDNYEAMEDEEKEEDEEKNDATDGFDKLPE